MGQGGVSMTDADSFIFSLVNPSMSPVKLNYVRSYSVYSVDNYGPTFGGGHDLYIINNANVNKGSFFSVGEAASSFQYPNGLTGRAAEDFFTDNYRAWYATEIETFTID
jgi:hypothetical protein